MADQSAIRIPQGGFNVNVIDTVTTFYCSPSGSDIDGDGSLTNPYYTPGRALNNIERMFFTDRGHAIVRCLKGTYDLTTSIQINNTSHKGISIAGETPLGFYLQEVTNYQYDAVENNNGYGNGSLVDNRITVKLADTASFPTTSTVAPSTTGIEVGDYMMLRDRTNIHAGYYPSQVDGSVASEGITGATGDARTNVLGCFEIIGVNSSDNTVTFRSRGKNFLHRLGGSKINADDGSFSVDDGIYVGGYRNAPSEASHETGDPTGKYGSTTTSGIDPTIGTVISDHRIEASIIKTVFKYRRSTASGPGKPLKGLVVKPNSSLSSLSNIVFQGDVRYKHFNEMNPAASGGEGILVYKNSSLGSQACTNIGICGFYAGMAAHTDSVIHTDRVAISDCSFGMVAEQNSSIYAKHSVITGCDIAGVLANGTSSVKATNSIVASSGYSPLTIDLDQPGTSISTLNQGERISLVQPNGQVSYVQVVWNSYLKPYTKMSDSVRDAYNYYPFTTGNQIYLRAVAPFSEETTIPPDDSGNEVPPPRILTLGGTQVYGVGAGVLPEESLPITYTPVEACGTSNQDISGGVCIPPGYIGDRYDLDADGPVNFNDGGVQDGGGSDDTVGDGAGGGGQGAGGGTEGGGSGEGGSGEGGDDGGVSCTGLCGCNSTQCGGDGTGDDNTCVVQQCNGEDRCCKCEDYFCSEQNGCTEWGGEGDPPCCGSQEECECREDPCLAQCAPGGGDDFCQWCTGCGDTSGACQCACVDEEESFCCNNPTACECNGEQPAECCEVDCTLPINCGGDNCCCNCPGGGCFGDDNKPCYCNNTSCGDDVPGTICPNGNIDVGYVQCSDCTDGDCECPPGTDNAGTCTRPCDDVVPDTTQYRFVDHPMGIGFLAYNNSSINAERSYVSLLRNQAYMALENSNLDVDYAFARGCAGAGFYASMNSSINARRSAAIRTRGGYSANMNSNVSATSAKAYDNAHYNFSATNDSVVNCTKSISFIGRTVNAGTETATSILSVPKIYSGMSIAHGLSRFGSLINKTGVIEQTTDPVTPNSATKWAVDSSSNIEPSNID